MNAKEIQFLSTWLSEHPELATTWPGQVVHMRVREVLSDGVIEASEIAYLKQTLADLVGGAFSEDGAIPAEATSLPIESNASVVIPNAAFCFTGSFLFGTRSACEKAVQARGGFVTGINKRLNYLVIGELSSREWKYSSFGTKINAAMQLKEGGAPLVVVAEDQWIKAL
ncbi:BRCT domain-containing protein [Caenimonas aquaedulcis]|uniref:BRCT domain-containing protein n=1 Tax=Caenimonas aquaedulcis TaxID=2793270 RepID=A0A931H1J6_9BURK|nr:BRCT domain-containing protein [Caenimonas aquaedulcis]MBG9386889.1 BRCT domain-containing protein [Caenimonas aquaedulcis]